ncbi:MAG: ATP-binding protein [Clostridium perfringens]|nr:ATP-binding protein [Clostridium perfringens]
MTELNKDSLLEFFKEPTIQKFDEFLKKNIGETNNVDFKSEWIKDISKIAQIILGIANSHGGCIVVGVEEKGKQLIASGIKDNNSIYDPADFTKRISKYIPRSILNNIQLRNFFYDNDVYGSLKGKKFQVIFISVRDEELPIICEAGGTSTRRGGIYIRRGTSTEEINYVELQRIIKRNLKVQSDKIKDTALKEEIEQLKTLYDAIPTMVDRTSFSAYRNEKILPPICTVNKVVNTKYPKKSFEEVLLDMIDKKQKKIEKLL